MKGNAMARIGLSCYALLLWASLLFAQGTAVPPQPLEVDGALSRVYKSIEGPELRLHIFTPKDRGTAAALPAIVFFFGGGWTNGTIDQFAPQSKHFAQRGMVAIVADYRVFGRHRTNAFEAIADAKSAIRWVRVHATVLGIDPSRLAAGGGSAGGHIALSAAVIDEFDSKDEDRRVSSKPNALVLFNPAVDTSPDAGVRAEALRGTLDARFGGRGREGSPFHHIRPGLPPMLILHGTADVTVPYADVERFCSESAKRGNHCRLVGYEGAVHGFFNPRNADGKWYREALLEADRFLTRLGYLQAQAPTRLP
jgi:acetyl esterase/lipase